MELETLLAQRHSVRGFLPNPVAQETLEYIVRSARLAPSGANLQPGSFIWLRGAVRSQLSAALVDAYRAGAQEPEDYSYFPTPMPTALRRRQVAAARALYESMGVARDDSSARAQAFERNFRFFDAPIALLVTIERSFGSGGYMDLGMALYGLMLAAQAQGLASCGIGALASYPNLIRQQLQLPDSQAIVCGMALGYADPDAPVNQTRTERCALEDYWQILG